MVERKYVFEHARSVEEGAGWSKEPCKGRRCERARSPVRVIWREVAEVCWLDERGGGVL